MMYLLSLILTIVIQANDKIRPELIIGAFDYPPYTILLGAFEGKGVHDRYNNFVIEELKKIYKVEVTLYPKTRVLKHIARRSNICSNTLFKSPDREKIGQFSHFNFTSVGNYMVMAKEGTFTKFKNFDTVSIEEILKKYPDFIIGKEQDTNYGEIQPILDLYYKKNPSQFFNRPGVGSHHALYRMLKSNRVQYTLAFASEAYWIQKQKSKEIDFKFSLFDIKEFKQAYGAAYFFCAKGPFGEKVIENVNKIIHDNAKTLRSLHEEGIKYWLPQKLVDKYMKYYDIEISKGHKTKE